MTVKVKICGLKTKDEVRAAESYGAEYIGLVFFHKSPRNITPKQAFRITKGLKQGVKKVAVVVDPTDMELESIIKDFKPDYVQCHGSESRSRIKDIKKRYKIGVIKAFAVRCSDDVVKSMDYTDVVDMVLFDAKVPNSPLPGGNGLSFDWTLLKGREFNVPWILSGGLNVQNVKNAIKISGAKIVDVSSSIESEPGVKDIGLIKEFIKNAKAAQNKF
ncbi:MAG: phosphoribosylanthranilate isomerase [Rickettsiales bacterium]|nr:phosphoribosylanthranilate isomerase [Pseudomonadota bacterium]MDA0967042.1 phosphoribosylanthranilate isomerase [Pseudomonadota bacterium]MDG4542472.1 phosphoribosylanthranilate isomerase [Rickettsiales bacterium]MDG4544976.1 phosphoribosylanthranilate isomerase [Rickettsiales bacterium]MDG4547099.1 phosphoribosylanthranilate isomerase [Rickettsiales bacterium]